MNKRLLLLAAALAAPAIAVIAWMLVPEPRASADAETGDACQTTADDSQTRVSQTPARLPGKTRTVDVDFPEPISENTATAIIERPQIATRFTPAGNPTTVLPRRDAVNGLGLQPTERFRILRTDAMNGAASASEAPDATPAGSMLLALDHSLHDPAAWVENDAVRTETQAAVKAKIADDFAAYVAAAAKSPEAATVEIDSAWRNAKTAADANYRKMFGDAAFNRASVSAGRAAVAGH